MLPLIRVTVLTSTLLMTLSWTAPQPVALAAPQNYCTAGQSPHYAFGFRTLHDVLGATMGEPTECEHPDATNGDTLQHTTTGLAFYRAGTNTPTFTDGNIHFALTSEGLVTWHGASIDPTPAAFELHYLERLQPVLDHQNRTLAATMNTLNSLSSELDSAPVLSAGLAEWTATVADLEAIRPPAKYAYYHSLLLQSSRATQDALRLLLSGVTNYSAADMDLAQVMLAQSQGLAREAAQELPHMP